MFSMFSDPRAGIFLFLACLTLIFTVWTQRKGASKKAVYRNYLSVLFFLVLALMVLVFQRLERLDFFIVFIIYFIISFLLDRKKV